MKYFIPDPYCDEGVTILHVMDGVWTMHAENASCETCINFIIRVAPVIDTLSDDDVRYFVSAMAGEKISDE